MPPAGSPAAPFALNGFASESSASEPAWGTLRSASTACVRNEGTRVLPVASGSSRGRSGRRTVATTDTAAKPLAPGRSSA